MFYFSFISLSFLNFLDSRFSLIVMENGESGSVG
jgi:hypothetical protein